jgi:hypothetical protein
MVSGLVLTGRQKGRFVPFLLLAAATRAAFLLSLTPVQLTNKRRSKMLPYCCGSSVNALTNLLFHNQAESATRNSPAKG